MRARIAAMVIAGVWVAATPGQPRFLLDSELYTDYSGGTGNEILTHYTYDNDGHRVERGVFDGGDTLADRLSTTEYSYDVGGLLLQEVLRNPAGDTLSIVQYVYDAEDRRVGVRMLRADLTLRYRDSLIYSDTLLTVMQRYNSADEMTFYHAFAYDLDGNLASDSLYEGSGAVFSPTQALLYSCGTDGRVETETSWRFVDTRWFVISTARMSYSDTLLVAVTTFEGDGATEALMDSMAYAHDLWGNRTREESYDSDRALVYSIDFTWTDTATLVARRSQGLAAERLAAARPNHRPQRFLLNGRRAGPSAAAAAAPVCGRGLTRVWGSHTTFR